MVERRDQANIGGLPDSDVAAFIEGDYRIRSGMCPTGHGLMQETDYGQECPTCGFFCNTKSEKGTPQ